LGPIRRHTACAASTGFKPPGITRLDCSEPPRPRSGGASPRGGDLADNIRPRAVRRPPPQGHRPVSVRPANVVTSSSPSNAPRKCDRWGANLKGGIVDGLHPGPKGRQALEKPRNGSLPKLGTAGRPRGYDRPVEREFKTRSPSAAFEGGPVLVLSRSITSDDVAEAALCAFILLFTARSFRVAGREIITDRQEGPSAT